MTKFGGKQAAAATAEHSKRSHGKQPTTKPPPMSPILRTPDTVSLASSSRPATPMSGGILDSPLPSSGGGTRPASRASTSGENIQPGDTDSVKGAEDKAIDYNDPAEFQRAVNESYDKMTKIQRRLDDKAAKKDFERRADRIARKRLRREWGFEAPFRFMDGTYDSNRANDNIGIDGRARGSGLGDMDSLLSDLDIDRPRRRHRRSSYDWLKDLGYGSTYKKY